MFMSAIPSQTYHSPSSLPSTPFITGHDSALAETQLLSELAQAANSAMVPLTLDEALFTPVSSTSQLKTGTSAITLQKRKIESRKDKKSIWNAIKKQRSIANSAIPPTEKHMPAPLSGLGESSFAESRPQHAAEIISVPREELMRPSAIHRRFGSEEVDTNVKFGSVDSITPNERIEIEDQDNNDDDDEDAPEVVNAADGFETLRSSARDAARSARKQKYALRAQRRKQDARLKFQAQMTNSQKNPVASMRIMTGAASLQDDRESQVPERQTFAKLSNSVGLPALLPDELLAVEPVIRLPKRLSPINSHNTSKKTKLLGMEKKFPKDTKRGNRIIRVLQSQDSILPPKSSLTSKVTREKWLMGQRGSLGAAVVPRRELSGGFVRR